MTTKDQPTKEHKMITIHPERVANCIATTVQTATVGEYDAWGTEHTFKVEWLPEVVHGVALGHENIGEVPVVWADTCPAFAYRSVVDGHVRVKANPVQVTFEREVVVAAVERGTRTLLPGTYRVIAD